MQSDINNSAYIFSTLRDKFNWLAKYTINDYNLFTVFFNIFLVFIPLVLMLYLKVSWQKNQFKKFHQKVIALFAAIIWLVFIPNTAYLITDVRHLLSYCPINSLNQVCLTRAWVIMFFFTYAAIGWVSFYFLVKQAADLIKVIFNQRIANFFVIFIIPFISLGVLLGLLNRWNSWEIIISPISFVRNISLYFVNYYYFFNWLIFTIFLYILYLAGSRLFKGDIYGLFKNR